MTSSSIRYIYLDLMRHTRPWNLKNDIHFAMFGTFDALHVEQIEKDPNNSSDPFEQMKRKHEERHGKVSWQSERQPMFLVSVGDSYQLLDVNAFPSDLDEHDKQEYFSYPLLLSVLQVEKCLLDCITFESLIEQTTLQLHSYLENTGAYGACFFNLGQSALTLAIRSPILAYAANAIISFWENGIKISNDLTLQLKSTSSHCAFRLHERSELRNNLKKWLKREAKQDNKICFRVDYILTDEYNQITQEHGKKILFGDLDLTDKLLDLSDYRKNADTIFSILTYHNQHSKQQKEKYISSSTIPIIEMNPVFFKGIQLRTVPSQKWQIRYNSLVKHFDKLKDTIKDYCNSWTDQEHLMNQIGSISMTLQGLYKYLHRLGVACFEYDLEAYTSPIFEKLSGVIKQLISIIKKDISKTSEDVHFYLVEFIMYTVKLITELQHLYSVLSISPNTFMETYGCSMRSLNAASTLLTAYQGILCYLNKNLPTKYYVKRGRYGFDKKNAEHTTLLIPYRMTTSSNIILYPSFSPKQRIALFHVDFTRMFNLKYTLFMLGHESGHMLGDQLREERFDYFIAAALRQYVERNILGWYFSNPVDAFLTLGSQAEAGSENFEENREKLKKLIGLPDPEWEKFYLELQKILSNSLRELITQNTACLARHFKSEFENKRRQTTSSEQTKSWYLDDVMMYLKEYIRSIFYTSNNMNLIKEFASNLSSIYKKIAFSAEDFIQGKNYNRRFFSRLKAYYIANYRESILYQRMLYCQTDMEMNMLDQIAGTFRDIHADIFACKLLNVSQQDYAKMLKDFAGYEVADVVISPGNLIRYAAIYRSVFDADLDKSAFDHDFKLSSNISQACAFWLQEHRKSSAYTLYLEFAKKCCDKIENIFAGLENEPQFKAIQTMYDSDRFSCDLMNAVLCMYSEVFNQR